MEFYINSAVDRTLFMPETAWTSDGLDDDLFQSELNNALDKQSEEPADTLSANSFFYPEFYPGFYPDFYPDLYPGFYPGYWENSMPSDPMVVISPVIEDKMRSDPKYAEELAKKINQLLQGQGSRMKDCIVIVNQDGEITQYCIRPEREKHPTAEELREVAKARARRQAKLAAYFHSLERAAIKRKLIEQENAKRFLDKKKRLSVSALDMMARTHQIKNPPAFTSRFLF